MHHPVTHPDCCCSPALGKFYIVTDAETHPHKEGFAYFWQVQDGPTKGQWVFDFGQNQAGYTTINLPKGLCAQAGELTVRQQFAEALHSEKGPVFHHFDQSKEQATLYCNAAAC